MGETHHDEAEIYQLRAVLRGIQPADLEGGTMAVLNTASAALKTGLSTSNARGGLLDE
jgi:hypothetical protein